MLKCESSCRHFQHWLTYRVLDLVDDGLHDGAGSGPLGVHVYHHQPRHRPQVGPVRLRVDAELLRRRVLLLLLTHASLDHVQRTLLNIYLYFEK